uniref:Uncharacterized protein n=1 Tax=Anguilla anguilla TaxID=7936 RepID=A0A0E9WKN2_ANGAN
MFFLKPNVISSCSSLALEDRPLTEEALDAR